MGESRDLRAGFCARCGIAKGEHDSDPNRCEKYLEPDLRTPEQRAHDVAVAQQVLLKRGRERKINDQINPNLQARGMGPVLPLVERETAMRGKPHVDYFPRDACEICGGVPWFNGRRIIEHHLPEKHNLTDGAALDGGRYAASSKRSRTPSAPNFEGMARVRRATGERDDDD